MVVGLGCSVVLERRSWRGWNGEAPQLTLIARGRVSCIEWCMYGRDIVCSAELQPGNSVRMVGRRTQGDGAINASGRASLCAHFTLPAGWTLWPRGGPRCLVCMQCGRRFSNSPDQSTRPPPRYYKIVDNGEKREPVVSSRAEPGITQPFVFGGWFEADGICHRRGK